MRRSAGRLARRAEQVRVEQSPRLLSWLTHGLTHGLADPVGRAPRLLSWLAEGAGIRPARGLSLLPERVAGRPRRLLGLIGERVVHKLPLVVLGTLAINFDTGPFELAGDAGDAARRQARRAAGRLIGTKELIVNGRDSRIRSVPCAGGLGLLLRLKQASRPRSEDLAADGWILRGRIRERLETARRLPRSAWRERRVDGIHRLNSGLADLGRLSSGKRKARENLRVGGPREGLA